MCSCTLKNSNIVSQPSNMMFIDPSALIAPTKKDFDPPLPVIFGVPPITVEGYITDEYGKPLSKAHVYVTEDFGTYTNDQGYFILEDVPRDELLTISHLGYGDLLQEPSKNMGVIILESEAIPLDAIYLTGDNIAQTAQSEKEGFPWGKILIGIGTTVASALIIGAVTRPRTFKGSV
jgi:hypothetical protein